MILLLALTAFWVEPVPARAARLKDLVAVEGVRENQLIGYGIVVGLKGTGDRDQEHDHYPKSDNYVLLPFGLARQFTSIN